MTKPTLQQISWSSEVPARRYLTAALVGDRALLAAENCMVMAELAGDRASPVCEVVLDSPPVSVALSPTAEFLLAVDGARARVWRRGEANTILEHAVDCASTSVGAVFARFGDREMLVHEPGQAALDAYELPSGRRIFQGETETFLIGSALSLAGGAHVVLIGYFRGEGKYSLCVVPTQELAQSADVLFMRFRRKLPISDYAYRLAAGAYGNRALVVFRDPEDDEIDDEYDEDANEIADRGDVRGLRGFYIRGLDGELVRTLAWDGPISNYSRLAATPSWIAAECGDEIALVPFTDEPVPPPVPARWLAASADGARVLVETGDGALAMLSLP